MKELGILFICFGVLIFLYGLYIAGGHRPNFVRGRYAFPKTKSGLNHLGKIIEAICIPFLLFGFSSLFFIEESIIPLIVFVVSLIITIYILVMKNKNSIQK